MICSTCPGELVEDILFRLIEWYDNACIPTMSSAGGLRGTYRVGRAMVSSSAKEKKREPHPPTPPPPPPPTRRVKILNLIATVDVRGRGRRGTRASSLA